MTRTTTTNTVSAIGTGAIATIPYTFPIATSADLVGTQRDLNGAETTLVLGTDYTVTGAGTLAGGNIVSVAAIPLGYKWVFKRERAITQATDLRNQGAYYPEVIEDALDKLTDIAQQHKEKLDRCLTASETDSLSSYLLPSLEGKEGYALGVVSGPALGLVASSAVALAADLADTTDPAKGPGMMGYSSTTAYPEGTIGYAIQSGGAASTLTYAEAQAETYTSFTAGGTAPAYTLTPTPTVSALTTQAFTVKFAADGTTGSNTLNVSGLGAVALKQCDASGALVDGVVKAGFIAKVKYNGTYWVILNPLQPQSAHGNGIMVLSSGSLVLKPWRGNGIIINGATCTIPSAGVSLAATGLTAGTLYFVYAYMNSGTMTLEAVTTAHTTGADGVEVKSGDTSRTLVGMARPVAGPAFSAASNAMFVRSWFNRTATERRPRTLLAAEYTRSDDTYAEVTRVEWLNWSDELVSAFGYPRIRRTESGQVYVKLQLDGADFPISATAFEESSSSTSYVYMLFGINGGYEAASLPAAVCSPKTPFRLTEGYHYAAVLLKDSGPSGSSKLDTDSAKTYGNAEILIEAA